MQNLIHDAIEYCMNFLNYEDVKSFMLSSKILLKLKYSKIYLKKQTEFHKIPSCFVKLRVNCVTMQQYANDKIQMEKDIANVRNFTQSTYVDAEIKNDIRYSGIFHMIYEDGEYIGDIFLCRFILGYMNWVWLSKPNVKYFGVFKKLKLLKSSKYPHIINEINKRWLLFGVKNDVDCRDIAIRSGIINVIHYRDFLYSPNDNNFIIPKKQAIYLLKCVYWLNKILEKWL